ncbi:uncharacterized protein B0I36DRAFT_311767 [Microdochium trichocladiopsis]|uniref:Uncharacterized protein n=1 Tax=Microdochium trichocladiopsis TaxID=1682393 RepID=A0A9P8YKZ9_9PEZI|nr:uncharacterized protein B0I36DRAFT_311767 [Microdochium trichocladiopsis]KAH7040929.1 hypothetical protein B0I36DRAFT_311767 [Microdochium trichocladiopsis]
MNHRDSLELPATKMLPKLVQDEGDPQESPTPRSRARTGIPRARTLNVLSNLTASMSRTSIGLATRNSQRKLSRSSRNTSGSSTTTQNSLLPPLGPAGGSMASGLAISIPNASFEDHGVPETPHRDPRHIYTAQSSEYWSGRFMALNDRFMSESLPEEMSSSPRLCESTELQDSPAESATDSLTELAPSTDHSFDAQRHRGCDPWISSGPLRTTSLISHPGTMPKLHNDHRLTLEEPQVQYDRSSDISEARSRRRNFSRVAALEDEDERFKRVFHYLEGMCKTSEARKSLYTYQQVFARRMNKEHLLPSGRSMEDRGWVGRLLSSSSSVGKGFVHASSFSRRKRNSLIV